MRPNNYFLDPRILSNKNYKLNNSQIPELLLNIPPFGFHKFAPWMLTLHVAFGGQCVCRHHTALCPGLCLFGIRTLLSQEKMNLRKSKGGGRAGLVRWGWDTFTAPVKECQGPSNLLQAQNPFSVLCFGTTNPHPCRLSQHFSCKSFPISILFSWQVLMDIYPYLKQEKPILPRVGSSNKTSKKKEKNVSFKIQKQNPSKGNRRSYPLCSLPLLCYEAGGGRSQERTGSTHACCSSKPYQLGNYLVNCYFWDLSQPCSRRRIPSKKKHQQKANNHLTLH